MSYGFVYILANEYMPDLIKIGCTERSPTARAEELSRHTGVPAPFKVLCYAEFAEFQAVERKLHEWLVNFRVSGNREFFFHCLDHAVAMLWFHPNRLSFTDVTAIRSPYSSELVASVCEGKEYATYFDDLRNPFLSKAENEAREAARIKVNQEIDAEVAKEAAAEASGADEGDETAGGLRLVAGGAE